MWLVDTSVWIATFQRQRPLDLESVIELDEIVTCLPVVQEVLQGFREEHALRIARDSLLSFPIADSPLPLEAFELAGRLYRDGRRAGVTIRSSTDCLIAAVALRHDLGVLHRDRDFHQLAKLVGLKERAV